MMQHFFADSAAALTGREFPSADPLLYKQRAIQASDKSIFISAVFWEYDLRVSSLLFYCLLLVSVILSCFERLLSSSHTLAYIDWI